MVEKLLSLQRNVFLASVGLSVDARDHEDAPIRHVKTVDRRSCIEAVCKAIIFINQGSSMAGGGACCGERFAKAGAASFSWSWLGGWLCLQVDKSEPSKKALQGSSVRYREHLPNRKGRLLLQEIGGAHA